MLRGGKKKMVSLMISAIITTLFLQITLFSTASFINGVVRVESGEDEERQDGSFVVEKFRLLLGLKGFYGGRLSPDSNSVTILSPSPAPSPAAPPDISAPSPAPTTKVRPHYSHPYPQNEKTHGSQKRTEHDSRPSTRTLVAALVPAGIGFSVLITVLFLYGRKLARHRQKIGKKMVFYSKAARVRSARGSGKKVGFNPGLDLLYLESLGMDLEQQRQKLEPDREFEEKQEAAEKQELDCASPPSTREIMPLDDEDKEWVPYDLDLDRGHSLKLSSSRDRVIAVEDHGNSSSSEESFHSLGSPRLSNVSVESRSSETPEPYVSSKLTHQQSSSDDTATLLAPPPPPPPPPPPRAPPRASYSRVVPKAPASSVIKISTKTSTSGDSNSCPSTNSSPSAGPPSIPPPPCPPPIPFLKRGSNPAPKGPPPPPPSQLPEPPPLGKDGSPLPKLKPLHWDKVRATPDRNMVWDKLRSSSFELDEEMIESLFGYNLQNPMKTEESKSSTSSPTKHVLDPKRLQNITILSKALNTSPDQVCDALMQGTGLSQQQLEALIKMVPTKEEEAKLHSYKGDINELGSAEKFVNALMGIPFASQRIEAMLYRETFDDEILHLTNSFSMLEEACKELRSSRLFLKLLEAVLKTGNRMNVGTIRGGAKAFKLDALLKLADIKGTDGKTTLLHFVVQEIIRSEGIRVSDSIMGKIDFQRNGTRTSEEKEEDYRRMGLDLVSGLSTELYNVKKTATIDLDVLASSVSNLSEGMSKLRSLLTKDMAIDDKGRIFVQCMKSFLGYAEKKLRELKEEEDRVLLHVREITEYFHGDVSKDESNPLRIFVIVRDLMGMLDNVCKELRNLKAPPGSPSPLAPFR